MKKLGKIDLHIHSTVSDGTDTPEEILRHVKETGIGLFALTDHDAIKGCAALRQCLKEGDPQFLTGVEFSCRDKEGQYHILGYGYEDVCSIFTDIGIKAPPLLVGTEAAFDLCGENARERQKQAMEEWSNKIMSAASFDAPTGIESGVNADPDDEDIDIDDDDLPFN